MQKYNNKNTERHNITIYNARKNWNSYIKTCDNGLPTTREGGDSYEKCVETWNIEGKEFIHEWEKKIAEKINFLLWNKTCWAKIFEFFIFESTLV